MFYFIQHRKKAMMLLMVLKLVGVLRILVFVSILDVEFTLNPAPDEMFMPIAAQEVIVTQEVLHQNQQ
jgi:hypothetical protein